jgi:integrase/recombinase XerC
MKRDIETKLYQIRTHRLKQMPDFIADFIMSKQEKMSLNTQIAYIKDYTLFFEYLLTLPQFKRYDDITQFKVTDMGIEYISEKDIWHFLDYLTFYKKTFVRKDGKEYTQTFTNTKQGKARKLASLHTLYEYLGRKYKIHDPTKFVEIEIKKKRQIKDRLDNDEINRFVDIIINDVNIENERKLKFHQRIKYRDLTILLLLAFTGIRISELVQLDINDISIKDEAMVVTRKGGNQEKLYVPEEIIPAMKEYISQRKLVLDVENEYKDALFLSNQKRRIDPKTVRYMLKKYAKRANIPITVTPHTLRRTFATKLLEIYGNIELVAQQLGHSSVETTRRFYADLTEETKRKAMKSFKYK